MRISILVFTAVCACLPTTALAQDKGLKVLARDVGIATFTGVPGPPGSSIELGEIEVGIGGFFRTRETRRIALQIEALIASRESGSSGGLAHLDRTVLDLPLLARWRVVSGNLASLYLIAGPAISVNFKSRVMNKGDGYSEVGSAPRLEPAFVAGAGFTYLRFEMDLRTTWIKGWDHPETATAPGLAVKGPGTGVSFGFRF